MAWVPIHSIATKGYAVLKYLIQRPGTLVTKQQLLDDVWPNTFVSDAVLKDCFWQLRVALTDEAKSPRFIETVIAGISLHSST